MVNKQEKAEITIFVCCFVTMIVVGLGFWAWWEHMEEHPPPPPPPTVMSTNVQSAGISTFDRHHATNSRASTVGVAQTQPEQHSR